VIGGGIAGLAAARALAGRATVELFEAAPTVGGHVVTRDGIDMGFIVCNRERYPRFFAMLDELHVATRPTTMSFSVSAHGLEWGSESLSALFAQRRRAFDPRHWRFLVAVLAFLRRARRERPPATESLDAYLARTRTPAEVRALFVVPLAAALWSLAPDACGAFPAATYLGFLAQHGMLDPVTPLAWRTVVGGSQRYVDALVAWLRGAGVTLTEGAPVTRIARDDTGVTIVAGGREARFDRAIVATHADTALALLDAPTADERRVLGAFRYSHNRTVLHTDRAFLPRAPAAHAAWNYVADPDTARVAVTYSMTRLQGLPDAPYLVTLNPRTPPAGILHAVDFTHPQFDTAALQAQLALPRLGIAQRTHYAGAYARFGFHEDGMRAGIAAAAAALA
jgi:hypothetical protein